MPERKGRVFPMGNNLLKKAAAVTVALAMVIACSMPAYAVVGKKVQSGGAVGKKVGSSSSSSSKPRKSSATASVSNATPLYDVALTTGSKATFTCVAPSGTTVKAKYNGKSVTLKPNKKVKDGVAVTHSGTMTMPSVKGTKNLGNVTYTVSGGGKSVSLRSQGDLFVVGKGATLTVRMKDVSSTVFKSASYSSTFVATVKKGAVDYVSSISGGMYKLGGVNGWISQSLVQPLTSSSYKARFTGVSFRKGSDYEQFVFSGTGKPTFKSYQDSGKLYLRFSNTSGLRSFSTSKSALFRSAKVTAQSGDLIIELNRNPKKTLWGYVVEYSDGKTILTCKYKPTLSSGSKPLKGIVVGVDAGHGGTDPGASANRLVEKNINLKSASAVKKKLESMGATVIYTRPKDKYVELSDRMVAPQQKRADFFLSFHCNAVGSSGNRSANGVEVYYYENIAKPFAQTILNNIISETGRANRGVRFTNFKVTLNTLAPSLLVEMGFITNAAEAKELNSSQGIAQMADAIANGIVEYLS